jgi:hypothetical protein
MAEMTAMRPGVRHLSILPMSNASVRKLTGTIQLPREDVRSQKTLLQRRRDHMTARAPDRDRNPGQHRCDGHRAARRDGAMPPSDDCAAKMATAACDTE